MATLALAWLLLGAACLNTSANVAWLARNVPGLGALASQETGMVDYGFLLTLPGDRAFPSRLSAAAWRATDRARARAAGLVLAENVRSAAAAPRAAQLYEKFLAHYAPVSDPFVHELRVHLFRRDRYVETAARHAEDPAWRARDLTVAVRENEFLERFAPETLAAGGLAWSDADRRARVALASDEPYRSRVAEAVVTRVRERSVWAAWLAGAAAIALAALRLRRAGDAR